jgi:hypothetical protein
MMAINECVRSTVSLYVHCTDFCICAANLTGLSYDQVHFFMYCVACPLPGIAATRLYHRQKTRLKKRFQDA